MVAPLIGLAKAYAINKAKDYATSQAETALGLPKDSIGAATNPVGFAKNIAKDIAKGYAKDAILGREEIPEEDRSRFDTSDSNFRDYDMSSMGGGGKSGFDEMGQATMAMKRGGKVKTVAKSSSASRRGDGIAQRGKTKGRYL